MKILDFVYELFQYLVLCVTLVFGAIFFQKSADPFSRFLIISAVSGIYVVWGIWHHWHSDRLNKAILFEYVLVAALVILLSALGMGMFRFL